MSRNCAALVKPAFGFTTRISGKLAMKPIGTKSVGLYGSVL